MMVLAYQPAVPSVFGGTVTTVALIVLLLEFGMLRQALLRGQIRLYAAQSTAVSVLAAVVGFGHHVPELYALAVFSFVLKVIAVPLVIVGLLREVPDEIAGSGAVGVANAVLISIGVAAFGFFAVGVLGIGSHVVPGVALSLAVAVVLVAFVLMIVRRDVVSQAIGFFSLENGASVASLVVAAAMPLILEVALLFDLLVAVVVFGLLARTHHRRAQTLSTEILDLLRG
ncbi:hydrogenase [Mycobacterium sp. SM1]|uniref:hydrogenase n=1 Tax=Mycobacterium sp. SM1 TaxID=2816243 RepID=UPI001BCAE27D|nr:hydrogenase [Mycobacterium sp. SM1]MBS4726856.1 hydrogenase [Mycobacterium sp. SM1]